MLITMLYYMHNGSNNPKIHMPTSMAMDSKEEKNLIWDKTN